MGTLTGRFHLSEPAANNPSEVSYCLTEKRRHKNKSTSKSNISRLQRIKNMLSHGDSHRGNEDGMFRIIHSGSSRRTGRPTDDPQTRTRSQKEGRAAPSSQPEEQEPRQAASWRSEPPAQLPLLAERRTAPDQVIFLLLIIMFLKLMPSKAE